MRRGLRPGWRRAVFAAGGTLAMAAVLVAIASAVAPAPTAPSPTVIAVSGPTAAPQPSAVPAVAAGVLLDGGVIVDQHDPNAPGGGAAAAPGISVPRPIATGPLTGLETGGWLLLWPFLLAISLVAATLWARRSPPVRPEALG